MKLADCSSDTQIRLIDYLLTLIEENRTSTVFSNLSIKEITDRHREYNIQLSFTYNYKQYSTYITSNSFGNGILYMFDTGEDPSYSTRLNAPEHDALRAKFDKVCRLTQNVPKDFDALLTSVIRADTITEILKDI